MASNTRPKDMRTWIEELEEAGELIRIAKPVDPLTQMGSLLYHRGRRRCSSKISRTAGARSDKRRPISGMQPLPSVPLRKRWYP